MKKRLLFVLIFTGCTGPSFYNNKGVVETYFKNTDKAQSDFLTSLVKEPSLFVGRYNLAVLNMSTKRLNDSLKELDHLIEQAEKATNLKKEQKNKILFQVYFAKAFLKALIQDIDAALEFYQKALFIRPNSKEVKKNIELLMLQQQQQGQSGKKGDSKKKSKDGESDSDQAKGDKQDSEDQKGKKGEPDSKDKKGQNNESLKKKNLSKEQIEQLLKEIKKQESKVRAKENQKNKGGVGSGKTW